MQHELDEELVDLALFNYRLAQKVSHAVFLANILDYGHRLRYGKRVILQHRQVIRTTLLFKLVHLFSKEFVRTLGNLVDVGCPDVLEQVANWLGYSSNFPVDQD